MEPREGTCRLAAAPLDRTVRCSGSPQPSGCSRLTSGTCRSRRAASPDPSRTLGALRDRDFPRPGGRGLPARRPYARRADRPPGGRLGSGRHSRRIGRMCRRQGAGLPGRLRGAGRAGRTDEGLLFAMPTRSTASAMMKRVRRAYAATSTPARLAHGLAALDAFYAPPTTRIVSEHQDHLGARLRGVAGLLALQVALTAHGTVEVGERRLDARSLVRHEAARVRDVDRGFAGLHHATLVSGSRIVDWVGWSCQAAIASPRRAVPSTSPGVPRTGLVARAGPMRACRQSPLRAPPGS